jgi:hypothetical protein
MTDAEIAGYMNWRGPGAYTQHQLKRVCTIVEEVQRREREACASVCDEADKESQSQWPKRLATMIRARGKA